MEMSNKGAYEDRPEAGMKDSPPQVVAPHVPDWSQFVTKDALEKGISQVESRLVRWMVGIFLAFLTILGGLITISLNIYNVLG